MTRVTKEVRREMEGNPRPIYVTLYPDGHIGLKLKYCREERLIKAADLFDSLAADAPAPRHSPPVQ